MSFSDDSSDEDNSSITNLEDFYTSSTKRFRLHTLRFFIERNNDNVTVVTPTMKRRKTRIRTGAVFYIADDGTLQILPYYLSTWYKCYVESPPLENNTFQKRFRRRFRLPYAQYLEIVRSCRQSDLFDRWMSKDATGKSSYPLELLILTALRYLGRGWTFDDLSESTGISEEVIRVFLHSFIEFGSIVLFNRYVMAPQTVADAKHHSLEFEMAGLAGAIGSMDATHVVVDKVPFSHRQAHLGPKQSCTSRTYNITVNHRRRILGTTEGHPARWNDKTIVRFDKFACGLKEGTILSDFEFELYDYSSNMDVKKVKYRGPWLLTDNGYHRWPTTIPPFKITSSRKEIEFSKWLESMRKDVECTFGILKGRWRILKAGIRLEGTDAADKVWKTCCALHNYLLEVDGYDTAWSSGVHSDWEGTLGEYDRSEIEEVQGLHDMEDPNAARTFDISGMGYGNDRDVDDDCEDDFEIDDSENSTNEFDQCEDECIIVRNLPFDVFRNKLVTHFNIALCRKEVR